MLNPLQREGKKVESWKSLSQKGPLGILIKDHSLHDSTSRPVLYPTMERPKGHDLDLIPYFLYSELFYQERIGGNDLVDEAGQTLAIPRGQ